MRNRLWVVLGVGLCIASMLPGHPNDTQRSEALARAQAAVDERKAAIQELIAILDDETVFGENREVATQAVSLLGDLRAEEAVPILLEHFDFFPNPPFHGPWLGDFPCAVALVKTGGPAAKGVVELIAADEERGWPSWLGPQVLRAIDGPAVSAARLTSAADRATDPDRKQRLLWAAAIGCNP